MVGGRATGRCTLMSGLSSVLEGIANTEVSEWEYCSCRSRSGCNDAI